MLDALDEKEKRIIKELVKNPRISDNQISRITKIPLKTVNRKRKNLEEKGLIAYEVHLDNSRSGTNIFTSKQMYTITFRKGITRANFLNFAKHYDFANLFIKHCSEIFVGEQDGCLKLILFIESYLATDIIEIFNADYFNKFESYFGKGCIGDVNVITINNQLQSFHNYFPHINVKEGKLKPSWTNIFIY
ncbi:MAG: Lrp/AsnC family transcriptional regulator [Nanoarchaeota archaeon]|nr:Lrp/AsnC family transcriptional regulator [Nanoarchaeota archaeon]